MEKKKNSNVDSALYTGEEEADILIIWVGTLGKLFCVNNSPLNLQISTSKSDLNFGKHCRSVSSLG